MILEKNIVHEGGSGATEPHTSLTITGCRPSVAQNASATVPAAYTCMGDCRTLPWYTSSTCQQGLAAREGGWGGNTYACVSCLQRCLQTMDVGMGVDACAHMPTCGACELVRERGCTACRYKQCLRANYAHCAPRGGRGDGIALRLCLSPGRCITRPAELRCDALVAARLSVTMIRSIDSLCDPQGGGGGTLSRAQTHPPAFQNPPHPPGGHTGAK